jgi:hypothetical protein
MIAKLVILPRIHIYAGKSVAVELRAIDMMPPLDALHRLQPYA